MGDDLKFDGQNYAALGFNLSKKLKIKAEEAKAAVIKTGKLGSSRQNSDRMFFSLEIRNDKLLITAIYILGSDGGASFYRIPTDIIKNPIQATWFTGTLKVFDDHATKVYELIFVEGKLTKRV